MVVEKEERVVPCEWVCMLLGRKLQLQLMYVGNSSMGYVSKSVTRSWKE